jgi:hypothetical protein
MIVTLFKGYSHLESVGGSTALRTTNSYWFQFEVSWNRWKYLSKFAIDVFLVLRKRFIPPVLERKQHALYLLVHFSIIASQWRIARYDFNVFHDNGFHRAFGSERV